MRARRRKGQSLASRTVHDEDGSLWSAAIRYFRHYRLAIKALGIKDWETYGLMPRSAKKVHRG